MLSIRVINNPFQVRIGSVSILLNNSFLQSSNNIKKGRFLEDKSMFPNLALFREVEPYRSGRIGHHIVISESQSKKQDSKQQT